MSCLRKKKDDSEHYRPSSVYTYLRICSTFGITLAMNIYLLSHLLGGWLDDRFGTSVLFRVILLFVALLSGFMYLWKSAVTSEKVEKELIESETEKGKEQKTLEERMESLRKDLER